jgi:hypothetical protein
VIAPARSAVIDTSALVAIATGEPHAERMLGVLEKLTFRLVSAGSVLELSLVLQARHGAPADSARGDMRPRSTSATCTPTRSPWIGSFRWCSWARTLCSPMWSSSRAERGEIAWWRWP